MTPEIKEHIQSIKDAIQKDIESDVEVCYTPESVLDMIVNLEKKLENETI